MAQHHNHTHPQQPVLITPQPLLGNAIRVYHHLSRLSILQLSHNSKPGDKETFNANIRSLKYLKALLTLQEEENINIAQKGPRGYFTKGVKLVYFTYPGLFSPNLVPQKGLAWSAALLLWQHMLLDKLALDQANSDVYSSMLNMIGQAMWRHISHYYRWPGVFSHCVYDWTSHVISHIT